MPEETIQPGELRPSCRATVNVEVQERVTTGYMCRLLDRQGEVCAMQVIPAACLTVIKTGNAALDLGRIVGGQS